MSTPAETTLTLIRANGGITLPCGCTEPLKLEHIEVLVTTYGVEAAITSLMERMPTAHVCPPPPPPP